MKRSTFFKSLAMLAATPAQLSEITFTAKKMEMALSGTQKLPGLWIDFKSLENVAIGENGNPLTVQEVLQTLYETGALVCRSNESPQSNSI